MEGRRLEAALAAELHGRAVLAWLESLPDDRRSELARTARVHVRKAQRKQILKLLRTHLKRNPYARAAILRALEQERAAALELAAAFTGPAEPDGLRLCRQLAEEEGLHPSEVLWVAHRAGGEMLRAAARAYPDLWEQARQAARAGAQRGPGPEPQTADGRRRMRELEQECRRLRAALARQERTIAGLQHRLVRSQQRISQQQARYQALQAALAEAARQPAAVEAEWRRRQAETEAARRRGTDELRAQIQAAQRQLRERDQHLGELSARLRRTRTEAEYYRTMYLTLDAYLGVTAPEGAMGPEAYLAYGRWLHELEAQLRAALSPESAQELAGRWLEVRGALNVHVMLGSRLLLRGEPEPAAFPRPPAGCLERLVAGGREWYYLRLPDRYHLVDPTVVAAVGALPGDTLEVEGRLERNAGSAHCYLFYHRRETRPRAETIGIVQPGGPPWTVRTNRGDLPVLGHADDLEPGVPVVVAHRADADPEGCLVVRVLSYQMPPRPAPPAASRTRSDGARGGAARRRPPLLTGRTIYILGGEGFESYYRQVVEAYGGRLIWTSGFNELRQIMHRVRQADAVVLMTRGVSHKAYYHLQSAIAATGRPLFYCNALGQSQVERVLLQEVIPALKDGSAAGQG